MDLTITYVHHNCFVLEVEDRLFLFDFPSPAHRPPHARGFVEEKVQGKNLIIAVSHGHDDHFTPEILELASGAESVHFILSYDIPDMFPEFDPDQGDPLVRGRVTVVEPDEEYQALDMRVSVFESTDLGCGFLLEWGGIRVYFGGDVALWAWPGQDERSLVFSREQYSGVLEQLAARGVHLAFSNADPRLAHWTGAKEFLDRVKPDWFAPMHFFGDIQALERFMAEVRAEGSSSTTTRFVTYAELGDQAVVSLP